MILGLKSMLSESKFSIRYGLRRGPIVRLANSFSVNEEIIDLAVTLG